MAKQNDPDTDTVSAEVVEAENKTVAVREQAWSLPATSAWDEVDELDQVEGFDLEANKMELVGVPFIITGITFRPGAYRRPGEEMPDDYASIELITAPRNIYDEKVPRNRARYLDDGVPPTSQIGPNETVVVNDSSTGIYRQIVSYLHSRGYITVDENLPRDVSDLSGEKGKSVLDDFVASWADKGDAEKGINLRLACKRGLRVSSYENDFTPEGKTYYIA